MHPPNSPKDNRKKSDISAARYNMDHQIPLGIFLKREKGVNTVLGLGIITRERADGVFIVRPYEKVMQEEIFSVINNSDVPEELLTEVLKEIKQRNGQGKFRDSLKNKFNTCAICKISNEYSIASHIKPWSVSTPEERLDQDNGLLLCPNHDYLFDNGMITFDDAGIIMISDKLEDHQIKEFDIKKSDKIELNNKTREYMSYHREKLFLKNT